MLCLVINSLYDSLVAIIRKNSIFHDDLSDPWDKFCTPDLGLQGYRIIQVGKDLWRSPVQSSAPSWVISEVRSGLEDLQGQRKHHFLGQPVPLLDCHG